MRIPTDCIIYAQNQLDTGHYFKFFENSMAELGQLVKIIFNKSINLANPTVVCAHRVRHRCIMRGYSL